MPNPVDYYEPGPEETMDNYTSEDWCSSCQHQGEEVFSENWNYFCLPCNQRDVRARNNNWSKK